MGSGTRKTRAPGHQVPASHFHSPLYTASSTSRNGHNFLCSSRKLHSALPFPARGAGPKLPASLGSTPSFSLRRASSRRGGTGAQRFWCPFAGDSPFEAHRPLRSPSGPRLLPPPGPRLLPGGLSPGPGRCPAPTAARKDAAWVPCQASECAAPPSRARNAAGPRGRRRHPAHRPARSTRQAGRWPQRAGPGFLLEGKQDRLSPISQATKAGVFILELASELPSPLPEERFDSEWILFFKTC